MIFRAAVESDLERILACRVDESLDQVTAARYRAGLDNRTYRAERTWIAEEDGRLLARAVWWAAADSALPMALDSLYVRDSVTDRVSVSTALLIAAYRAFAAQGATEPPAWHLFLPVRWRDEPAVSAALAWRGQAAAKAGLSEQLERLRYEWTSETGLPRSSGRSPSRRKPMRSCLHSVALPWAASMSQPGMAWT